MVHVSSLRLLLGTEAPVMTPDGIDFSFFVSKSLLVFCMKVSRVRHEPYGMSAA